ncbi:MAG TPA: acetyl-CoA carboxylase biotin carboxyl carrier protein [Candidatus Acidoferrum sp.]|nr:acetyl-CoA carboxylase biotin carboxyl carrier protein [Candidatus Acidoferrum sp.]
MSLTHHDIQAILKIIDDSPYDELRLDNDEFSFYLKRTAEGWTQQSVTTKTAAPLAEKAATASQQATAVQTVEPAASEAGLIDIRAPMVGTFYRAPQPGAAPFVEIGAKVEPNTLIAIIEVMKLMSSIPALVSGTVREILVQDAQMVEKGQLLMRVKP